MFDLEHALAKWRGQMTAAGITDREIISELESHLRDEIEQLVQSGMPIEAAFERGVQQLGHAEVLQAEFGKVESTREALARAKNLAFTLAGIPNHCIEEHMNTLQPHIEPRWATYLKAAAFLLPAVSLWCLSVVFVMPKLQHFAAHAGGAPLPGVINAMMVLTQHGTLILAAFLVMLGLLEWRSTAWARYRRLAVGMGTFVINGLVLVSIFMMVVTALLIAPALAQAAAAR